MRKLRDLADTRTRSGKETRILINNSLDIYHPRKMAENLFKIGKITLEKLPTIQPNIK